MRRHFPYYPQRVNMSPKFISKTTISAILVVVPALTYFLYCKNKRKKLQYVFDLLVRGYNMIGIPEPPRPELMEEASGEWETVDEATIDEVTVDEDHTADELDIAHHYLIHPSVIYRVLRRAPVASVATSDASIHSIVMPTYTENEVEVKHKVDVANQCRLQPTRVCPRKVFRRVPVASVATSEASIESIVMPNYTENELEVKHEVEHKLDIPSQCRLHPTRGCPRKVFRRVPVASLATSETSTDSIVQHMVPINVQHKPDTAHHCRMPSCRDYHREVASPLVTSEASVDSIVEYVEPNYTKKDLEVKQKVELKLYAPQHCEVHPNRAYLPKSSLSEPLTRPITASEAALDSNVQNTGPTYTKQEIQVMYKIQQLEQQPFDQEEEFNIESHSDTQEGSATSICTVSLRSTEALHNMPTTRIEGLRLRRVEASK